MSIVREVFFERVEVVRFGKMTDHLWRYRPNSVLFLLQSIVSLSLFVLSPH
jgi:hypothetical protein